MTADRKLSDQARASFAKLFQIPGFGDAWASILCLFSEAELQECERAIGLERPNPEFRAEIADAVLFCFCMNTVRPKRYSEMRKEFILFAKRATAAAVALEQLSSALDPSSRSLLLEGFAGIVAELITPLAPNHLRKLAVTAERLTETWRGADRGGPTKMLAFDSLIRLLADAFARGCGCRAGIYCYQDQDQARYQGRFWNLVEAVLPKVEAMAEHCCGRRLAQPSTKGARGRFIERVLLSMDTTRATAP